MKNINKKNNGITLIALVITIIVLLLLAGISISMLSGQDGILTKATRAKEETSESEQYDKLALAVQEALVNGMGKIDLTEGSSEKNSLEKALEKVFGNDSKKPDYKEGEITLSNGKKYTVSQNGTVEEVVVSSKKWKLTTDQGQNGLSVGDLVTYKEKTTEQFYVIKVDGDNVAMLAAKNITTTGTLEQSDSAPAVEFANTSYWSSETNDQVDDLNDYTDKTDEEKNSMGVVSTDAIEIARAYGTSLGVKGRLITVEEVVALGGDRVSYTTSGCTEEKAFVNEVDGKKHHYWLGSANSEVNVWFVHGETSLLSFESFFDYACGVRPVIEISISSIE